MATPPEILEYSGITVDNNELSLDQRTSYVSVDAVVKDNSTANGLVLIFCNEYSNSQDKSLNLATLHGAVQDGENMVAAFRKLNYAILLKRNLSMQSTIDTLRDIARFKNYPASYRRIVVIFSGHGTSQQQLYANDGTSFSMQDMISLLSPRQAPHLGNIPKLFFIDACRGKLKDQGVYIAAKGDADIPEDVPTPKGGHTKEYLKVPSQGNCLVAYSTLPEHMSFESTKGGLWMSCLANKIATVNKTITDILIDVNTELIKTFNFGLPGIQQPEYVSQLNETINFYTEAYLQKSPGKQDELGPRQSSNDEDKQASPSLTGFHSRYCQPRVLIPTQCTTNYEERLKGFCTKEGKPEPCFTVSSCKGKTFVAEVYVAKTIGRFKGEPASSKQQAKENAARALIERLQL